MDTQTIFAGVLLIVLILIIFFTWTTYPNAKYIVLTRTDGESKYIAIKGIEVIDNHGARRDIIGLEGKNLVTSGFANSTSALAAIGGAPGDVLFNGRNMAYIKDTGIAATMGPTIGPLIAAVMDNGVGYILFSLGCPAKIARINVYAVEDDISRTNLQRVKVYLLDKDKKPIEGAEQIIPTSSTIPQSIHHIRFV